MTARVLEADIGLRYDSQPPTFGWECERCQCRSTRVWGDRLGAEAAAIAHNRTFHGPLPARHRSGPQERTGALEGGSST